MKLLTAVRDYIVAICSGWISLLSGVFSIAFTAAGLFGVSERYAPSYWYAAGVLSYIITSFTVWYRVRPRLLVKLDKVFAVLDDRGRSVGVTSVVHTVNFQPTVNTFIDKEFSVYDGDEERVGELSDI